MVWPGAGCGETPSGVNPAKGRGSLLFHLQFWKGTKPLPSTAKERKKILPAVSEHSLLEVPSSGGDSAAERALNVPVLGERDPRAGLSQPRHPAPLCRLPARRAAARAFRWPHGGTRCQKFAFQNPPSPIPGGLGAAAVPVQSAPLLSLHPSREAQELLFRASAAVNSF